MTQLHQLPYRAPAGATTVLLIRHGATEPITPGTRFPTVDGHGDPCLSDEGTRQAQLLADRLAGEPFDAVYVTKLRRTPLTAAPLVERLGLATMLSPDLHEVFLGDWEAGEFRIRLAERDPLFRRIYGEERWDVIPGAEPLTDFDARLRRGLNAIVDANPERRVAVVTHGGVIAHLLHQATGAPRFTFVDPDNTSISELVFTDRGTKLRRFNDTAHLG